MENLPAELQDFIRKDGGKILLIDDDLECAGQITVFLGYKQVGCIGLCAYMLHGEKPPTIDIVYASCEQFEEAVQAYQKGANKPDGMTQLLQAAIDDIDEMLLQAKTTKEYERKTTFQISGKWIANTLFTHYLHCACIYALYLAERCELDDDVLPMLKDIAERMKQRKEC